MWVVQTESQGFGHSKMAWFWILNSDMQCNHQNVIENSLCLFLSHQ